MFSCPSHPLDVDAPDGTGMTKKTNKDISKSNISNTDKDSPINSCPRL